MQEPDCVDIEVFVGVDVAKGDHYVRCDQRPHDPPGGGLPDQRGGAICSTWSPRMGG